MKMKPLQDWALIQRVEPEEKTAGGIIIPESAKEKPTEGIVLAIGPGKYEAEKGKEKEKEKKKKFIPTVLKPGQRIIYGKYSAREFDLDGETLTLVREEDVLGTVEETSIAHRRSSELEKKHEQPVAVKKKTSAAKGKAKK
jgi:chaperonin GroES